MARKLYTEAEEKRRKKVRRLSLKAKRKVLREERQKILLKVYDLCDEVGMDNKLLMKLSASALLELKDVLEDKRRIQNE